MYLKNIKKNKLLLGFVALMFFPLTASYFIIMRKSLTPKTKIVLVVLVWLFFLGTGIVLNNAPSSKVAIVPQSTVATPQVHVQTQRTESVVPTTQPQTALAKINQTAQRIAGSKTEVTVWHVDAFATDNDTEYNVVVNFSFDHSISSCQAAKSISYELMKDLYQDSDIRAKLSRVIITIPYYLRTSLGATDGVPIAEKNAFNGPTAYWNTLEQLGLGENESGKIENRTWGVLLTKCQ